MINNKGNELNKYTGLCAKHGTTVCANKNGWIQIKLVPDIQSLSLFFCVWKNRNLDIGRNHRNLDIMDLCFYADELMVRRCPARCVHSSVSWSVTRMLARHTLTTKRYVNTCSRSATDRVVVKPLVSARKMAPET